MRKTNEQIVELIQQLNIIKFDVPKHTGFGDSNLDAINAQIEVLERNYDNGRIYDEFEYNEYQLQNALDVYYWREGDGSDIIGDWKTLL